MHTWHRSRNGTGQQGKAQWERKHRHSGRLTACYSHATQQLPSSMLRRLRISSWGSIEKQKTYKIMKLSTHKENMGQDLQLERHMGMVVHE